MREILIGGHWEVANIREYLSDVVMEYPEYQNKVDDLVKIYFVLTLGGLSMHCSDLLNTVPPVPGILYRHIHSVPSTLEHRIEKLLYARLRLIQHEYSGAVVSQLHIKDNEIILEVT